MNCQNCGEDALYDKRNGKRCALCGWRYKPKTGLIEERPTKPHDAVCGELIYEDGKSCLVKKMCNDNTTCSFNPTSMQQLSTGQWIAVCSVHDDDNDS